MNFLPLVLVFLSMFVVQPTPSVAPPTIVEAQIVEVEIVDQRVENLNQFFRRYKCPQPYRSEQYVQVADKYDLPYELLPVLSLKESTCGKRVFRPNNYWGYGSVRFLSVEEGMNFVADKLANGNYYKGKTLDQKLRTYNSVNKDYPSHTKSLMQSIDN